MKQGSYIIVLCQLLCSENLNVAAYFKNFTYTFNTQIHSFKS